MVEMTGDEVREMFQYISDMTGSLQVEIYHLLVQLRKMVSFPMDVAVQALSLVKNIQILTDDWDTEDVDVNDVFV